MSLEKILARIREDALLEAEKIISETRKRAESIIESAEREGHELGESLIKEADRVAQAERSRIVTQARLEKRLEVLALKREMIEKILETAFSKENLEKRQLRRKVIMKGKEIEEPFEPEKLIEKLRPKLERFILDILGI